MLGGVNDWLAESLPINSATKVPIKENLTNPVYGAGRKFQLMTSVSINEAVESIKKHISIPHLRLALAKGNEESI